MKNINQIIKNNILNLVGTPKSVCVALSGGADSVCLLHNLKIISDELGFQLSAVHINHNIRGEEAKRDAEFCSKLCSRLGIPLNVFNVFVLHEAMQGESVELAARRLRYEAFEKIDAEYIATAHNADDSLETFIINFCRGTGLKGLIGIPNIRGKFIRPINNVSKSEILDYIKVNNLDYVTDSTNLENDYTRNKIRNKIIPLLKEISPEIVDVSARNLNLLKQDNAFLEEQAEKLYCFAISNDFKLKTDVLLSNHRAIVNRVLSKFTYKITEQYPDSFHINLMYDMLSKNNSSEILFNGFYAVVKKGYFYIERKEKIIFSSETEVVSYQKYKNLLKINKLLLKNAIDYDKIVGELVIRSRKPNDRLRPFGRGLSKPVRKLQSEANVNPVQRDTVPIAADSIGPIWGYQIGVDERVAINNNTKNVLIFKVYKDKNGGQ